MSLPVTDKEEIRFMILELLVNNDWKYPGLIEEARRMEEYVNGQDKGYKPSPTTTLKSVS